MSPLATLLQENRLVSAEWGGQLANHLSMAAIALDRLGAAPETVDGFAQSYRSRHSLVPLRPPRETAPLALEDLFGRRDREAEARLFFEAEITARGRDWVLRTYLPLFLPGLSASAFHPMIRTAYALETGDDAELGVALAFWAVSFGDLGRSQPSQRNELPWRAALAELSLVGRPIYEAMPKLDLIFQRLEHIAQDKGFSRTVDQVVITRLDALAEMSLALLAGSGDFTALHALTASHAFRVISPWIDDTQPALDAHWRALAAAYISIGAPEPPSPKDLEMLRQAAPDHWQDLAEAAIASKDDHQIKLLYSAQEEAEAYGDAPLYRAALAVYLQRL